MSGTGQGKRQLVEGIREDLTRIRRECESLTRECEKVHADAKGLNGWPAIWKGVSKLLSQAASQLQDAERSELSKLQGGLAAGIVSDFNAAQAEAVKVLRDSGHEENTHPATSTGARDVAPSGDHGTTDSDGGAAASPAEDPAEGGRTEAQTSRGGPRARLVLPS